MPIVSQDSPQSWDSQQSPSQFDPSEFSTLVLRPVPSNDLTHKAPLAPKQGPAGPLANSGPQNHSPISGTYALRTPRGKITSIACESCRKRKSKCDGVRPRCNTCQSKNVSCVYDVAEDGKTTTQLRTHVKRLERELEDVKSILPLLIMTPNQTAALEWASEIEKHGFSHHSVDEIRKTLQEAPQQQGDIMETSRPEVFPHLSQALTASSYDESSQDNSREQSQPALTCQTQNPIQPALSFTYLEPSDANKFSFDCSVYRRTKQEMLADGWDEGQVFGRNEVDVDSILLGFTDAQEEQSVPTWAARMVCKTLVNEPLPVRLASAYLLTKMMRWLIWPSIENMKGMPEWLVPLAQHDSVQYDILVDLLPWPELRQYLYQHPGEFVVGAFVGFVSLNWPYADESCHYWDMHVGYTRLTPLFETHINDLRSWTMEHKALEVMPALEGMVPVKAS
ncbi:hypothetical protein AOQ84DRAFT_436480 [Glonium stellatum]|uniref:Zn(2)-C6 fungal-type domain-containing protein n=1 Tax=Glonium stellatum TaxID=574774 RepID=A0A8E2JXY4_9PEZI|nr:hypothetical protein AOQ84DRAFT_436480 [Glonium stellatum]